MENILSKLQPEAHVAQRRWRVTAQSHQPAKDAGTIGHIQEREKFFDFKVWSLDHVKLEAM